MSVNRDWSNASNGLEFPPESICRTLKVAAIPPMLPAQSSSKRVWKTTRSRPAGRIAFS
ncbi:hypothetical protein D3C83_293390 [compost metagenome]